VAVPKSSHSDNSPAFSPDGERIAFVSNHADNEEIWVSRPDGARAVQLTSLRAHTTEPRWSPDGRHIAFSSSAPGNAAIYVVESDGGVPRLLNAEPNGSFTPSWSPDGEWIYFTCGSSGSREIWKIPAEGGAAKQLTHTGAYQAQASPDGKLVYFSKLQSNDGVAIWSIPASGGPEKPVPELEKFDRISRSWGVIQQGIYFMPREDPARSTVRFLSFQTREVTPLFPLQGAPVWDSSIVVMSRDGRYALTVDLAGRVNQVMMIENFR
jgi:Tol biopolymer transport system component